MGFAGKVAEKEYAISLREKGYSYNQIQKITGLSKDTISRSCRDVVLTSQQIKHLESRRTAGQMLASIKGAKANQLKRQIMQQQLLDEGIKQVGELSVRDKFIFGISLYLGEGSKTGSGVEFTNSDPSTVLFMYRWFKDFCEIPSKDIRASLWIHDNLDESKAKTYWSELLGINLDQFDKSYIAKNKLNSLKVRKNIHQYGIIKLRYYSVVKLRLILGWIKGVLSG
ncbi:hypothetical protein HYV64_00685 [Candidatus Shapirobacteria bacterium]|nr:hypothetical protein [Candidatus Shapirobacteria bacterium]